MQPLDLDHPRPGAEPIEQLWDIRLEQELSRIHELSAEANGLKPKLDVLWSKLEILRARRDELAAKRDELQAKEDELQAKRDAFQAKQTEFLALRNQIIGEWEVLYSEEQTLRELVDESKA